MSVAVLLNGITYTIPQTGEESWGENLTTYFVAIPQGVLQKTGGAFTLTADVNFGANFGLLSQYYKTRTANIASAGQFRLARADVISWRNQLNNGNLDLSVNTSNQLLFDGSAIYPGGITALTGDVTATGPGSAAATIAANAVTDAKFRQSAGLSVVGNATNITANCADITAGTDNFILRRSGTALGFGLLVNANVTANTIALSKLVTVSTQTFLGRTTASTGDVESLTATQATAILNSFVGDSGLGGTKGLVPAPASGDAAALKFLMANGTWAVPAGAGTVTSVALTMPTAIFDVAGSPLTTNGTLAVTFDTQSANRVFAGPLTGSAATPTMRALGNADVPLTLPGTKTANYSATVDDGLVNCNTNAFTVTLPAANAMVGQVLRIQKIGSDTNQITVARAGSDTIGTAGATSTTIATQGEMLTLVSDGSSIWYIQDRTYPTSLGNLAFTAGGLGTISANTFYATRIGKLMRVTFSLISGTVAASTALFTLPSGYTIDTSALSANTNGTYLGFGTYFDNVARNVFTGTGFVEFYDGSTNSAVYLTNTAGASNQQFTKINGSTVFNSASLLTGEFTIPITGWN